MKIQTMEKYIRNTAIPYTELLDRAVKGGLKVTKGTVIDITDSLNKNIRLYPYNVKDINEGMVFVEYNYSKY